MQREAFGAKLIDKPLMQNVVADLEVETEVGTMMVMRLAGLRARPNRRYEAAFGGWGSLWRSTGSRNVRAR